METRKLHIFRCVALCCLLPTSPLAAQSARPALFYDPSVAQLAFAAHEIAASAPAAIPESALASAASANCAPCIVLAGSAEQSASAARAYGLTPSRATAPQAYSIRRARSNGRDILAVLAADANGAMYGALDIAEALRLGRLNEVADSDHAPHIAQRGIKFNIPLDARTPSYSDNSDAAQANIPEMWSLDFWREFLDEMARHRYNVLSLWNLHPFPSMVRVPEYPDVALQDVKRTTVKMDDTYSHSGNDMVRPEILEHLETVRSMTMGDKIAFWREVMQYARSRGIDVYIFTWNIFTFGAEGKYGITPEQNNPKTIAYFRASVRELVLTYPLLAGIGITAGEQMTNRKDEFSKEKWLWNTYGEGLRDALKLQPGRKVSLIHRYHQTGQEEIFREFKEYPGPFALSFKYSIAHMYSIPDPPYIHDLLTALPAGQRTWLTVRNDDVYSFRWGNAQFARDYIRNIPGPDKIAGFNMGPDGYVWGREFLSANPHTPRQTVISKQWYSFLLWGRLSYDPELPDAQLERIVGQRLGASDAGLLLRAWSDASMVFPLITRFFWGDIDVNWFPEACLSYPGHRGYYTVRDFMEGQSMPGSGVVPILEWRKRKLAGEAAGGTTPQEIAASLEKNSAAALAALPSLRTGAMGAELRETVTDIEAMAWLERYYSLKVSAAASLALYDRNSDAAAKQEAVRLLQRAVEAWRAYAKAYLANYTQPHLYNRVGVVDIPALTARAQDDVRMAQQWQPGTIRGDTPRPNAVDQPFRK
ncbi:MAG TPA: hypothetical protein VG273_05245 [Bryobacteraceae bacterium]|nr:hypothetical protein [Bryobacteraceae bacterium]